MDNDVLQLERVKRYFSTPQGVVRAVDDVSFAIQDGETFGLVGESGSGKTTVAHTVLGIYTPTNGDILLHGQNIGFPLARRPKSLKRKIQVVFQDPSASLNPRRTIKQILQMPLVVHDIGSKQDREKRVAELLQMVELSADYMFKVAAMLSGGERARVAIARALATTPDLVILDEPTSALDVSIQAKIIDMLVKFQQSMDLTYLFITHDLSLMRNIANKVAIMYLGQILEIAPVEDFFQKPLHPYTRMLLSSVPVVSEEEEALKPAKVTPRGEIASPVNVPPGCRFHPRCPEMVDVCLKDAPQMIEVGREHYVRCHLYVTEGEVRLR